MSRRPLVLLALAVLSALGGLGVWLAAFHAPSGGALDGQALEAFAGVAQPPLRPRILGVASLADPWPFAIAATAIVVIALLRRRWFAIAVVPAILLAANATTQQLKPALADLRIVDVHGVATLYPGSWPSGHATAAMSLALCLVLVASPRLRPLAALAGATYAVAVGYALVVLGFHLPSDVLGGYLVAATFALLGAAALAAAGSRRAVDVRASRAMARVVRPPAPLSGVALAAVAVAAAAGAWIGLVLGSPGTATRIVEHPVAMLAAVAIASLGVALTTGLARVLRR